MTEEEQTLFNDYQEELEKCYYLANDLDNLNPDLKGAYMGTPSERILRQLQHLNINLPLKTK